MSKRADDAGALRLLMHRKPKGKVCSVTVIRDGPHWYASVAVALRPRRRKDAVADRFGAGEALRVLGLDRGVTRPVALSEPIMVSKDLPPTAFLGFEIETRAEMARLKRLQQSLARKARGSKNRLKARLRLASHKARLARRRKDMLRKIAAAVMRAADIVVLEDLRVKNMTASAGGTVDDPGTNVAQKAGLNRAILDKGWGMLLVFMREIAARDGKRIVLVNPRNTSRECGACGTIDAASRDRESFRCRACGHADHADVNAAKVLVRRARAQIDAITKEVAKEVAKEIAQEITAETMSPCEWPVERRCQPVESSHLARSMKQEKPSLETLLAQDQT